jgi:drug/metabolite transporter (DMT)-like permease
VFDSPKPDNLKFAIAAILIVCFALSLGDALIKQQCASFGLWQIFLMCSVVAIPVLICLLRLPEHAAPIIPRHPGWTLLRGLVLAIMWVFYFAAPPKVSSPG